MARSSDYYGVLGVSRDASAEELKRRYRQLVRTHHPDVADDAEAAHHRFIKIVEAYRVLSDPVQRRAFDALQAVAPPPVRTQSVQVEEQIGDWFRHAVHRLEEGDLSGAAAQCRKILGLDPQHAAAQAMLGDVCAAREEWDQALVHYSGAVSSSPRNINYARKLRGAAESGQRSRAAAERRERAAEQRQRALEALNYRHEFGPYATLLAACWVAVLLAWMVREDGAPLAWPPLPLSVLLAAAGCGVAVGFALGLNRVGRPPAEPELARTERWAESGDRPAGAGARLPGGRGLRGAGAAPRALDRLVAGRPGRLCRGAAAAAGGALAGDARGAGTAAAGGALGRQRDSAGGPAGAGCRSTRFASRVKLRGLRTRAWK